MMENEGSKLTREEAAARAESVLDQVAPLGDVTLKRMFGGYGIFESGVMFVLVDPHGVAHLRADESTEPRYVDAGCTKHGMPYWTIPADIESDDQQLTEWAAEALDVARAVKRRKRKK